VQPVKKSEDGRLKGPIRAWRRVHFCPDKGFSTGCDHL